tara:strand:+ start:449 stop:1369 length:921 start_codon:yes stop_codon:yes gene_type:complete
MVSRPTSSQTKDISNSEAPPNEGDWWEGFTHTHNLGNGCGVELRMIPNGSIGLPSLGKGLKSPISDITVEDIKPGWGEEAGPITVELDFEMRIRCGRYTKQCKKENGCKASVHWKFKAKVDIDFMFPEGPEKDKFKDCLMGWSMTSTCVLDALPWFDELTEPEYSDSFPKPKKFPKELHDMIKDPAGWWLKGVPEDLMFGPNGFRGAMYKAIGDVLAEMFSDYKKDELKKLEALCQCGEMTVVQQEQWTKENIKMMEDGPLERYQNIFQEYLTAAYNSWKSEQNDIDVTVIDVANISVTQGIDVPR